jgi:2,5-diamino-6-(ribosylamino)-4(3H)-pyrimidinone 5'-phosphate reductase
MFEEGLYGGAGVLEGGRPEVTVNCAMTADGKIAGRSRRQLRISSTEDLERVKILRKASDAILVGVGTVLADDPHLTVKGLSREENPLRVVLDSGGRTPPQAKVLDGRADTLIVTSESCDRTWPGVEVLRAGAEKVDLTALLAHLYERGVRVLMVEGGGETIFSFFQAGLVDRYLVYVGSMVVGGSNSPTPADGDGLPDGASIHLTLTSCQTLGDGVLLSYEVRDGPPPVPGR